MSPRDRKLNHAQAKAVATDHPKVVVIAGAGAGKTRVLAARLCRLLEEGVPAEQILAITFTRDAAAEMRSRLEEIVPATIRRLPEIRTFHSWGAQLLRRHAVAINRRKDFSVYDEVDEADMLVCAALANGIKPTSKLRELRKQPAIRQTFELRLRAGNALTFDMITTLALRLLTHYEPARREWQSRYQHVAVDEYQDTNLAQVAILAQIEPPNLFVVGDARQAIYGFRGADPTSIKEAASSHDYEVIELSTNYRSVPGIVLAANFVSAADWLPMVAARPDIGRSVFLLQDQADEHQIVERFLTWARAKDKRATQTRRWGDMAVLARTWKELEAIHLELTKHGIPATYYGKDGDPWASPDGRAVARMALLMGRPMEDNLVELLARWADSPVDIVALRAMARKGRRTLLEEIGADSPPWSAVLATVSLEVDLVDKVRSCLGAISGGSDGGLSSVAECCLEVVAEQGAAGFADWWSSRSVRAKRKRVSDDDAIHLMTLHGAKGLEWPVVAMIGAHQGNFGQGDEARRLIYVGVTRARDLLMITSPNAYKHGANRIQAHACAYLETLCKTAQKPATT